MKKISFVILSSCLLLACGSKEVNSSETNDNSIKVESTETESVTEDPHTPRGIDRHTIMQLDDLKAQLVILELDLEGEQSGDNREAKCKQIKHQAQEIAEKMYKYIELSKKELVDLRDNATSQEDIDFYDHEERKLNEYIELANKYLP